MRDHYASYGPNPVVFAAHLPTAVHDLDGDGADDWLVCSENFYGVISVKDNRDLVGPVVLSDALPGHWTAYSYPSLGKVRSTGEPGVLHNNSYALGLITDLRGRPIWHHGMTRDTAGTWGILADVDGDGAERVRPRPAGRLDPLLRRRGPAIALRDLPARDAGRERPEFGGRSLPLVDRPEAPGQPDGGRRPRRRRPTGARPGRLRREPVRAGRALGTGAASSGRFPWAAGSASPCWPTSTATTAPRSS